MKERIYRQMQLLVGLSVVLTLVACTPAVRKKAPLEPDIISRPGLYQDNSIGFAFTWRADLFSVAARLKEGERVRVSSPATIPVLTISVQPKKWNAPVLHELGDLFLDNMRQNQVDSGHYRMRENKIVRLADGTEAEYVLLTWKFLERQTLVTAAFMAYKANNLITVEYTALPGQPSVRILKQWLMKLKLF